jgi:exopolysaccharide biosynthesis polyprenyl glycosylphosphotransferase
VTVAERRPAYKALEVTAEHPIVRPSLYQRKPLNPSRVSTAILAGATGSCLAVAAAVWSFTLGQEAVAVPAAGALGAQFTLAARGHFRVRMVPDTTSRVPLIGAAVAIGATMAIAVASTRYVRQPDAPSFLALLLMLGAASLVAQSAGVELLRQCWRKGRLRSKALVLGSDALARELAIEMQLRKEYGVDVVGFISNDGSQAGVLPAPVYHTKADLSELFGATGADRLLITPANPVSESHAVKAARWAGERGIPVFIVPRFYEMGLGMDSMTPDRVRGYPLVRLQRAAHPRVSLRVKRFMDVAVAGSVLVVSAPVLMVAAVAVRLSSSGPIFFGQERVGQDGRRIMVYKLRSMTVSGRSDTEWTADARVTAAGKFLRRSNIDELPQLWSILRGDMSLVGPRPERPAFVEKFRAEVPNYDDRHRLPVGLTGLAQIVGLRGDTSITERVKYDNLYIDQWSLGTDLQILAKTVVAVVRQTSYRHRATTLELALRSSDHQRPLSPDGGLAA